MCIMEYTVLLVYVQMDHKLLRRFNVWAIGGFTHTLETTATLSNFNAYNNMVVYHVQFSRKTVRPNNTI